MKFQYIAYDGQGRRNSGLIEAETLAEARHKLASQNFYVERLEKETDKTARTRSQGLRRRRGRFNRVRFFAALAVLMEAGLTIDQALRSMAEASKSHSERTIVAALLNDISAGMRVSESFARLDAFSNDVLALIASGERSAKLPLVMNTLATDLTRRQEQKKALIDAAIYPAFLILMMFVAIGVITFVLVPGLEPVFESADRQSPTIIVMLSMLRGALLSPPVMLSLLSAAFLLFATVIMKPAELGRFFIYFLLKTPLVGSFIRLSALTRYLESFALLISNSVSVPDALSLAADCCPIESFRSPLAAIREKVSVGERLANALEQTELFPKSVPALIAIGDDVNKLGAVLNNAAAVLRFETEQASSRFLALLTPAITIILGLLVGGLVISVMTALLSINDIAGL